MNRINKAITYSVIGLASLISMSAAHANLWDAITEDQQLRTAHNAMVEHIQKMEKSNSAEMSALKAQLQTIQSRLDLLQGDAGRIRESSSSAAVDLSVRLDKLETDFQSMNSEQKGFSRSVADQLRDLSNAPQQGTTRDPAPQARCLESIDASVNGLPPFKACAQEKSGFEGLQQLYNGGEPIQSILLSEQLLRDFPASGYRSAVLFYLGTAAQKNSQMPLAIYAYQAFLNEFPNAPQASLVKDKLEQLQRKPSEKRP